MIRAVDLFAGAGGASTGLVLAADALRAPCELTAINHWPAAVETHATNHPRARHLCMNVEAVDPRDVCPGGKLDLLIAGPECTFFSMARGGKPINDQRRSSPWLIFRWLELLQVDRVLVENVPEMRAWGPLGTNGKPLKSKRGVIYRQWFDTFERYGFKAEERLINAADFGEATTRTRLFVQAVRGRRRIVWPEPTHGKATDQAGLFGERQPWRPAREVVDLSNRGRSIFGRSKPLIAATMRRINEGLVRFGGEAFVLSQASGGAPRHIDEPMPTLATDGAVALVQPFLVPFYGERPGQTPRTHSLDAPIPTLPASPKFGLVQFTMPYCSNGGRLARPVSEPMGTITTKDRIALVQSIGGDVFFRMLTVEELAAAMGFPPHYQFIGPKQDRVKMIGNAWSVRVAEALCRAQLRELLPNERSNRVQSVA